METSVVVQPCGLEGRPAVERPRMTVLPVCHSIVSLTTRSAAQQRRKLRKRHPEPSTSTYLHTHKDTPIAKTRCVHHARNQTTRQQREVTMILFHGPQCPGTREEARIFPDWRLLRCL